MFILALHAFIDDSPLPAKEFSDLSLGATFYYSEHEEASTYFSRIFISLFVLIKRIFLVQLYPFYL